MKNIVNKLFQTNTLKRKLSNWLFISVISIYIFVIGSVGVLLWTTLHSQIDHHIHIVVNEAKQIVENYKSNERDNLLKQLVSGQGMTVVLLSPDGTPSIQTNSPDVAFISEHQMQQVLYSSAEKSTDPTHFTASKVRFAAMPVMVEGGHGILAVGYSLTVIDDTLKKMIAITIAITVLVMVPLLFLGNKSLNKSLDPLSQIAKLAGKITDSTSLAKRVNISKTSQELMMITTALNTMMERLETTFSKEHEFFSDTAHTLKTPLAVIRSQVESLPDKHSVLKTKVLSEIDNAAKTIQDLLLLSQLKLSNKSKNKHVNISRLLTKLAELTQTLGEDKNVQVIADIEGRVNVLGNEKLINRALGNIIQNAVIYSKKSGIITIKLEKKSNKAIISIADNGIGIKKSELKKIFNRFYRGENQKYLHGSGLGLTISKEIIESMGGRIEIISKLGKGTQVKIIL